MSQDLLIVPSCLTEICAILPGLLYLRYGDMAAQHEAALRAGPASLYMLW